MGSKYKTGDIVEGVVVGVQAYGAFIKLEDASGLVHISEISNEFVKNIEDFLTVGNTYSFYVIDFDEDSNHVKLSFKRIAENSRKERYRIKTSNVLNENKKFFEETFNIVKEKMYDPKYECLLFKYKDDNNNEFITKSNYLDFETNLNLVSEKYIHIIRKFSDNNLDKIAVVTSFDRFKIYESFIDLFELENKLVFIDLNGSKKEIDEIILKLKGFKFVAIFDLFKYYDDNADNIFKSLISILDSSLISKICFCGVNDDKKIEGLVSKYNLYYFASNLIKRDFSIYSYSSLCMLSYLKLNIYELMQGMRFACSKIESTSIIEDIFKRTKPGTLSTTSPKINKLVECYKRNIDLDISIEKYDENAKSTHSCTIYYKYDCIFAFSCLTAIMYKIFEIKRAIK